MISNFFKKTLVKTINIFGYSISKSATVDPIMDKDVIFKKIYENTKDYTMTSKERMFSLYKSVEYIIKNNIPGDFVECGVWKGGSTMLIAYTLIEFKVTDRKIFLYDTFEGMSQPTENDFKVTTPESLAERKWENQQNGKINNWCYADIKEVRSNMHKTGYPENNLVFVKGKVEETISDNKPSEIAILRLDTDWYESTKYELLHLYPHLTKNGVLIIDDYGHWAGAKKAVDEYFSEGQILLNRVDITGRVGVKV